MCSTGKAAGRLTVFPALRSRFQREEAGRMPALPAREALTIGSLLVSSF
jgi:hypothetical protein